MDTLGTLYKFLSDQLGNNAIANEAISFDLNVASVAITALVNGAGSIYASKGDFTPHSLKQEINDLNNNIIIKQRITIAQLAVETTKALQFHITYHFGDINEYYKDQGIKVKPEFAELSARAGYTINSENIL